MDLRSIIMNSEIDLIANVYEVVHQIRQIFYSAKLYLQVRKCLAFYYNTLSVRYVFRRKLDPVFIVFCNFLFKPGTAS